MAVFERWEPEGGAGRLLECCLSTAPSEGPITLPGCSRLHLVLQLAWEQSCARGVLRASRSPQHSGVGPWSCWGRPEVPARSAARASTLPRPAPPGAPPLAWAACGWCLVDDAAAREACKRAPTPSCPFPLRSNARAGPAPLPQPRNHPSVAPGPSRLPLTPAHPLPPPPLAAACPAPACPPSCAACPAALGFADSATPPALAAHPEEAPRKARPTAAAPAARRHELAAQAAAGD